MSSNFCPCTSFLVTATHFLWELPSPFQVILKEMVTMGLYFPLATVLTTCDLDIISQVKIFHSFTIVSDWEMGMWPSLGQAESSSGHFLWSWFLRSLLLWRLLNLKNVNLRQLEAMLPSKRINPTEKWTWERERERQSPVNTVWTLEPAMPRARSNRHLIYSKIFSVFLSFLLYFFFLPFFLPSFLSLLSFYLFLLYLN